MKNFRNKVMYICLLMVTVGFFGCQDEFEEVIEKTDKETLAVSSATVKLITDTTSKDGSFDNIVDETSCFAINFPYTVNIHGLDIIIDSIEDLRLIEEIFDKVDTDVDILDILFPITITLADFTEIVINNQQELREVGKDCIEGGDDDDIECIDFVYPITLYTFDINKVKTGKVVVTSDKELKRFFAGLDKKDIVSVQFPISLKFFDGTEISVNSNEELAQTLERAKNICDEDDDNDHNDDDFTKERLDEYLVKCPWLVKEVKRNAELHTEQYFGYILNFKEDGEVVARDKNGNVLKGTWNTRVHENKVLIKLEFDNLVDFTLEWYVYEIGEGRIKLYAGDGNRIVMKKSCDILQHVPDTLRGLLRECSWVIKKVKVDGVNINRMLGFEFNFEGEGVVTLSDGETTSNGTWEITKNEQDKLVMAITMGNEPGVSFEWLLSDLRDRRLKFNIEGTGYELILERDCKHNDDEDVKWIRGLFDDTSWGVNYFAENEDEGTASYDGYTFNFKANGAISVLDTNNQEAGSGKWFVYRNSDDQLELIIRFATDSPFYDLANDYKILEVKEDFLDLKHYNDGDLGWDRLKLGKL
ncbi:MAG: hypothetical protein V3U92_11810 [Cellulophaga sp.]